MRDSPMLINHLPTMQMKKKNDHKTGPYSPEVTFFEEKIPSTKAFFNKRNHTTGRNQCYSTNRPSTHGGHILTNDPDGPSNQMSTIENEGTRSKGSNANPMGTNIRPSFMVNPATQDSLNSN
jgi:hypothetical protein